MSRIGDWGERDHINVYRRGLESRLLDQLASYPGSFDTLQELMDIILQLDTRHYEIQKEKGSHQEKKPPITGSILQGLLNTHIPKGLTIRRTIRASNFKLQRKSPILLRSLRTINYLVLKRRGGSKKGCVLIVVESTQLKNASRDLRTSLGHQEASLASREKPEWG
ncbi:hypothetical protein O181_076339 [Austropuccinia psidii MF-1]|uniref:Uncharacterized protein n=1 Tax=Austropuccinia psidii MF-1 TaxID=1389203 RepID=A0A9Q3FCB3_9BASI|nr:hypothetical protein [Austropuccinia psidii MF-1]